MVREHEEVRLNKRMPTNRWEVVRLAGDGRVITDRWPLHEEDSNLLNALLARFAAGRAEPTTAQVKRAAAALMDGDPEYDNGTYGPDDYEAMARAALRAAWTEADRG